METNQIKDNNHAGVAENFAAMFEESLKRDLPQEGDIVKGVVLKRIGDQVFVDFGYKCEGVVSASEFAGAGGDLAIPEGAEIDVYFEGIDEQTCLAVLSKERADALRVWDRLVEAADTGGIVEGTVLHKVKGGLSVDIGVKAFLPGSQIDVRPVQNLDKLIGKRFKFKILKLNKRKGNIIVSRRALLQKDRESTREESLQNVQEGQDVVGIVKNITDYGVFLDLGGVDGLLHITDMTWGRLGHPSEICKVGDDLKVRILKVDNESGKVSLGLKQLSPDPWQGVEERFPVGTTVKGKIVNITDYGAFLEMDKGVEGLIHISEMSWGKKVKHPSKVVALGDQVEAQVLDLDAGSRRISLGMKQMLANPWDDLESKFPVGTKLKSHIKNVTDFGLFVELSDEIDGLAHASDLSWVYRWGSLQELYKKGDEIEVVVLNIDKENERFSLGVKHFIEDPWPRIESDYGIGTKLEGKIAAVLEKGIVVRLMEGVEGFVSMSQIPAEWQDTLKEKFPLGKTVDVIVHSIEERDRKILLGLVDSEGSSKK